MSNSRNTTQKIRLFNLLSKGQEVSTAEAALRCSIANVSAVIWQMREDGLKIHTHRRTDKRSGKAVYKYRLDVTRSKVRA